MYTLPYQKNFYNEHSIFQDSVSRLLVELAPDVETWEHNHGFPNSLFEKLGDLGFLGLLISEDAGGVGGDFLLAGAWCEKFGELRSTGLVTGVNMHSLVITRTIDKYGTYEVKEKWLADAIAGKKIGAYAFTEPNAGSDLAALKTTAKKVGDKWEINGSKIFITNGKRADFALVLTKTDPEAGYNGFTTFLIDTKTPGFSVSRTLDKLGWYASDTAILSFDNMIVDESCVLGKVGEGWKQAALNLDWERLMLALTSLGGARACFKDTVKYLNERSAFKKKLIDIPVIKDTVDEMYARIVLGELQCHDALLKLNSNQPCRAEIASAKKIVCEDAIWIADKAIQLHGGYGYTKEYSPERWWRDLRLMTLGGGTSEIMGEILGKELLR